MLLIDILRPECIEAQAALRDKTEALREIARIAGKCDVFSGVNRDQIVKGLEEREKLGSTGFGGGIAIPHCRMQGITEFVIGVITVAGGVDFDAADGEKVRLITFIIGPDRETNEHIRLLSTLSRTLKIPGFVDEILRQNNPESIYESYLRYSSDTVATGGRREKQLCHVFIQDEELFEDILSVFAAVETSSVAIIDAKNIREYLSSMPLFAGFWSDSYLGFNRIITAVVDKSLINEILRNIESISGSLDKRSDMMVTVQDIFYTAGSLEA